MTPSAPAITPWEEWQTYARAYLPDYRRAATVAGHGERTDVGVRRSGSSAGSVQQDPK